MSVTISSNYYEENNIVPLRFRTSNDAHRVEIICTDLLLNGETWNQVINFRHCMSASKVATLYTVPTLPVDFATVVSLLRGRPGTYHRSPFDRCCDSWCHPHWQLSRSTWCCLGL